MVELKTVTTDVSDYLNGLLKREKALRGYLNKNVLATYRNLQRKRWITKGTSEDPRGWPKLNPEYAKWKAVKFSSFPGKGTKMMIRTGDLFESVIGPGKGFRKIVENRRLYLATTNPYASFANERRSFTSWSEKTIKRLHKQIARFVFKAILKSESEIE